MSGQPLRRPRPRPRAAGGDRVPHPRRPLRRGSPRMPAAPAVPEPLHDPPSRAIVVRLPARLTPYARTLQRWRAGGEVTVLRDGGETYPAMLAALAAAERSICFETYILAADATGDRFKAVLLERAHAGVAVRIIYDAVGSFGLPDAWVDELRAAGCEVIDFNPISPWRRRFRMSHRDHRKILVVDDRVGFTGGLNIANDYASVEDGGVGWHDMHCRVTRAVVLDLAPMFPPTRLRCGGTIFPPPPPPRPPPPRPGTDPPPPRRQHRPDRPRHVPPPARQRPAPPAHDRPPRLPPRHQARPRARADPERVLPARPRPAPRADPGRRARRRRPRHGPRPLRRRARRVGRAVRAATARPPRHPDLPVARRDDARQDRDRRRRVVDDRQLQLRRPEPVQQPRGHRRDPRRRHRPDPDRQLRARHRQRRTVRRARLAPPAVVAQGAGLDQLPAAP